MKRVNRYSHYSSVPLWIGRQSWEFTMADLDTVIMKCVDGIWAAYDTNGDQFLDREETKKFISDTLFKDIAPNQLSDVGIESVNCYMYHQFYAALCNGCQLCS
jgi:hypothetical protein